ncbi:hypothetical protein [Streptomyces sp. NPDC046925]|uniref:hypothetical protein n=1 Tax=Streptomyces sp. NPDC046925 TaxID=3155375 RepID=UPI003404A0E7
MMVRIFSALCALLCAVTLFMFGVAVWDTFGTVSWMTGNPVYGYVALPGAVVFGAAAVFLGKEA